MRKTLLMSAALLALAYRPALAQNSLSSTMIPPSPNAGQGTPEPTNSLPSGASTATRNAAGEALGATGAAPTPAARPMASSAPDAMGAHPMRGRMHRHRMAGPGAGMADEAGMAGVDAPPTSAYRGGAGVPLSDRASNIAPSDTRSEIAPRLANPAAADNTPEAYLAAAQRALASGKTGAAQEALERAETRLLSRSTEASAAGSPADMPMVQQIGQARQALATRDIAGARSAIRAALGTAG